LGPLMDIYQKPNSRGTVITLRGHAVPGGGLYLGCMRDEFPGTDGLDRVSCVPGEEWLRTQPLPDFIVAEGATLAPRGATRAPHETPDLLLVHPEADPFVKELRCAERGSSQAETFVAGTATRAANLALDMAKENVQVWTVDSADTEEWNQALEICV